MAMGGRKAVGRGLYSSSFLNPRGSQASNSSFTLDDDDLQSESLESLIKILKRPSNQRNLKNLQTLIAFARYIKFFQQESVDLSEETITQCCIHMTYEFYNKGEYVFLQGEQGSKFYIVLDGSCTVIVNGNAESLPTPVNRYGRGDSFGELALIQNKPRAASIICVQDSHFAVLDKEDYSRILAKVHEIAINRKADFLQSLPMFAHCSRNSIQKLIYYFKERSLQRKHTLYHSGDQADTLYFVRDGEVQILQEVRVAGAGLGQKSQVVKTQVAILGKGECLGCEDVLGSGVYQYTGICHSQIVHLLTLSKDDFLKRVSTEETIRAVRELVCIKEQLRKDHAASLYNVQSSPTNKRRTLFRTKPMLSAREREVQQIASPKKGAETARTTGSPEYRHLYPFHDRIREGERISPTSEIGLESINSIRRLKSWDLIFAKKRSSSRTGHTSRSTTKVVNIHTHNQRLQDSKHLAEYSTRMSLTSSLTFKQTPRYLNESSDSRPSVCLAINSVEVVPRDSDECQQQSPRLERLMRTPHSQFRLKKVTSSPTLAA